MKTGIFASEIDLDDASFLVQKRRLQSLEIWLTQPNLETALFVRG